VSLYVSPSKGFVGAVEELPYTVVIDTLLESELSIT
jgi:hypothetical protein